MHWKSSCMAKEETNWWLMIWSLHGKLPPNLSIEQAIKLKCYVQRKAMLRNHNLDLQQRKKICLDKLINKQSHRPWRNTQLVNEGSSQLLLNILILKPPVPPRMSKATVALPSPTTREASFKASNQQPIKPMHICMLPSRWSGSHQASPRSQASQAQPS